MAYPKFFKNHITFPDTVLHQHKEPKLITAGIDIAAPENSNILAIADGVVSYIGWYGANGYTVILKHSENFQSIYGHISPNFIVKKGENIKKGQLIALVGPKYIEKTSYTTYQDSSGKNTNGATTGPHLHFAISQNNIKINPLSLYTKN